MALTLRELAGAFSVLQFTPDEPLPAWVATSTFYSVTKTPTELSIVCETSAVKPGAARDEAGWRAFVVDGPLDFALTGILSSIAAPLAEAGMSIFALSTFDTDYVLVKAARFADAMAALTAAGLTVYPKTPSAAAPVG